MQSKYERATESALALRQQFSAYGDTLERVEVFKYLGRLLSMEDDDGPAINANVRKARRSWARLSRVLRAENAAPRVCGMFYKATVMAVLLFGAETWCLTPTMLKRLEGFHLRAAYRMNRDNRPRRRPDGTWAYPASADALDEAGLRPLCEYVQVRRDTIARYVAEQPLFAECKGRERMRGSSTHLWWWEQPMALDE